MKIRAMNLDFRLIRLVNRAWVLLVISVICGLAGGILIVNQARLLSHVIAGVHLGGWTLQNAEKTLGWFLLVLAGRFFATWMGEGSAGIAASKIKKFLRQTLVEKLNRLGPVYLTGERTGEITTVLGQGLDALDGYFGQFLPQIFLAVLVPLCILIVIFPLDWISGLTLALTAPLLPFLMILIGSNAEKLTQTQWGALSRMSSHFLEMIQGLTTLKALNQTQRAGEKLKNVNDQYRRTTLQVLRVTFLSSLALELLSTISVALVAVQLGLRLLTGAFNFELALFIIVVAPDFYLPLRQLGLRFHTATAGISAARRIFEILDAEEHESFSSPPPNIYFDWKASPQIELVSVTARYPGSRNAALSDIHLVLKAGSVTALVGRSGTGKSTMANLILGFLQPESGQVLVNGINLQSIDMPSWRKGIAWVSQSPTLFFGTLAENLGLGLEEITELKMWQALEAGGLAGWVKSLPEGISTRVGEKGLNLSSGQVQRLALCRAFLKPAGLVVLDEPTAHLDVGGEKDLLNAMHSLCQRRTVLLIAHRLSTLHLADRVVVLGEGKLIQEGVPEELLGVQGPLKEMVQIYSGSSE